MPYIVTVRHPQRTVWEGPRSRVVTEAPPTRTAVATLDEARHGSADVVEAALGDRVIAAQRMLDVHDPTPEISETYDGLLYACHGLPESGGMIGPLPDGTVIEVRPLHWDELRAAAKVPSTASDGMTVAVFNAKQA